jgi:hypothetical protein
MPQFTDKQERYNCPVVKQPVTITKRSFPPLLGNRGIIADQPPDHMKHCNGNKICKIFNKVLEFWSVRRDTGCPYHDNL